MKTFQYNLSKVRDELYKIILTHKCEFYEYKHPSGVIKISVTPANAENETTEHEVYIGIWEDRHSLSMTTSDLSAAAAMIASLMCMNSEVESD